MQSKLIRNFTTIASSTVLTQAAMLAVMPLLTRLYSPKVFGLFAIFSSLHAILLIISTLKYDTAIVIPADDGTARNLLVLSSALSVITGILTALVLGAIWILDPGTISPYYFLLPISIVLVVVYGILQQWGARRREYGNYAISQLVNTAFNLATSLTLAILLPKGSNGLIIGFVVGAAAGGLYLIVALSRHPESAPQRGDRMTVATVKSTAISFANMPKYVLPFTILIVIAQSFTPLILQANYSLADIGHFAVASRILLAPTSVIGAAIGEPFRAELAARLRDGHEVGRISRMTILTLTGLGATGFGLIFLLSRWFFPFAFGAEYTASGVIAQYICIGAFGQFVALPVTYTFVMTGHLKTGLGAMAAVALIPSTALVIAAQRWAMTDALLLSSVLLFATSAVLVYLAYRCALAPNTARNLMEAGS
jgi:O-antigen/teichoic acid export membrane protein